MSELKKIDEIWVVLTPSCCNTGESIPEIINRYTAESRPFLCTLPCEVELLVKMAQDYANQTGSKCELYKFKKSDLLQEIKPEKEKLSETLLQPLS